MERLSNPTRRWWRSQWYNNRPIQSPTGNAIRNGNARRNENKIKKRTYSQRAATGCRLLAGRMIFFLRSFPRVGERNSLSSLVGGREDNGGFWAAPFTGAPGLARQLLVYDETQHLRRVIR